MEVAVKTLYLSLNPKGICFLSNKTQHPWKYFEIEGLPQMLFFRLLCAIRHTRCCCVSPSQFEDFSVMASSTNEDGELRISVEVSGTGTRAVFDNVFNKMVAAAQPIPGFRRVKGEPLALMLYLKRSFLPFNEFSDMFLIIPLHALLVLMAMGLPGKTPDIPREILLEVLGPSKVYKEVIKKIINSTVAEYVEKEGLEVSKDLKVEQSFEDLEDEFEPDEKFSFDAVIRLQANK